jgi:hypothetical protein
LRFLSFWGFCLLRFLSNWAQRFCLVEHNVSVWLSTTAKPWSQQREPTFDNECWRMWVSFL